MKPLTSKCVTYFDVLRYSLAQVVLIGHGFGFFFGYWDGFFPKKVPYIQSIAVVGFFFVSGFLICRSVLSNIKYNGGDYVKYYIDRFARIYTTLIPCLLFVVVCDYFGYLAFPSAELAVNFNASRFFDNIFLIPSMPFGTMRPIWSLMFEWWIYILFGGLVFFRKNMLLSCVFVLVGGYYTFFVNSQGLVGHLEIIWFLGALSAFLFERVSKIILARYVSFLTLSASVAIYLISLNAFNIYAGVLLSIGLLFCAASFNQDGRLIHPRVSYALSSLAGYSFTLFLTHYTIMFWLQKLGMSGVAGFSFALLLSNIVAYIIAHFSERYHKLVSAKLIGSYNFCKRVIA